MNKHKAAKALIAGSLILDDCEFFVDAGTLLGIHRDGTFIPHDTDVDLAVIVSTDNFHLLPERDSHEPVSVLFWNGLPMQTLYNLHGVTLDFYFFYDDLKNGSLVNVNGSGVIAIPKDLVLPIRKNYPWDNLFIRVPNLIDDYLAWRYGQDWVVPKRSKEHWSVDHPNLLDLEEVKGFDGPGANSLEGKVSAAVLKIQSHLESQEIQLPEGQGTFFLLSAHSDPAKRLVVMQNSASWKITAPMRAMAGVLILAKSRMDEWVGSFSDRRKRKE